MKQRIKIKRSHPFSGKAALDIKKDRYAISCEVRRESP